MCNTLIILDVQKRLFNDLFEEDKQKLRNSIIQEIELAKENDNGIIVCEYDVKYYGETMPFVIKAYEGYKKAIRFEHTSDAVGQESLAIARQQKFARDSFRICGLYLKDGIAATKKELEYNTNYQINVVIVDNACANRASSWS